MYVTTTFSLIWQVNLLVFIINRLLGWRVCTYIHNILKEKSGDDKLAPNVGPDRIVILRNCCGSVPFFEWRFVSLLFFYKLHIHNLHFFNISRAFQEWKNKEKLGVEPWPRSASSALQFFCCFSFCCGLLHSIVWTVRKIDWSSVVRLVQKQPVVGVPNFSCNFYCFLN